MSRSNIVQRSLVAAAIMFGLNGLGPALSAHADTLDVYQALDLMTMQESALVTTATLVLDGDLPANGYQLSVSGAYTDSGWSLAITSPSSPALAVSLAGAVSGTVGNAITIDVTGSGSVGAIPISVSNAVATFPFDASISDYDAMNYVQETTINDPINWWAVASERITVVAALGPAVSLGGYLSGDLDRLFDLSKIALQAVLPPATPPPPTVAPQSPFLAATTPPGQLTTQTTEAVTSANGTFIGQEGTSGALLIGSYGGGSFSAVVVPEPQSLALAFAGLVSLGVWRGVRRRGAA
jgi:hypothetical protein